MIAFIAIFSVSCKKETSFLPPITDDTETLAGINWTNPTYEFKLSFFKDTCSFTQFGYPNAGTTCHLYYYKNGIGKVYIVSTYEYKEDFDKFNIDTMLNFTPTIYKIPANLSGTKFENIDSTYLEATFTISEDKRTLIFQLNNCSRMNWGTSTPPQTFL
ncbi:MAG: hypothetical protein ACRC0A_05915 [Chitinophagaceae bacterium]